MVRVGLYVKLQAAPGRESDVEGFLRVIELVRNLSPAEQREFRQRSVAFVASRFTPEFVLPRFVHEALGVGLPEPEITAT